MSNFTPTEAFEECRKYCDILARTIKELALEDGILKEGWDDQITRFVSNLILQAMINFLASLKAIVMPSVLIGIFGRELAYHQ